MSVKMIKCKVCGNDIARNAKTCPHCGANNKKPFYKKWWVWVIVAIICIIGISNSGSNDSKQSAPTTAEVQTDSNSSQDAGNTAVDSVPQTDESDKIPAEYKSALNKAKSYSEIMHMSKKGIYNQLTSEYGEKFSAEAAQYAIDNLQADYNKNALEKAKSYQKMDMSPNAIRDQLISEYGELFTEEEADYAIANLE